MFLLSAGVRRRRVFDRIRIFDLAYLWYALRVRFYGLDLSGVSTRDLGLSKERAHGHSHSGGPDLERVLSAIGVPPGSRVIDFGSGKGGACLTLADAGFDEVLGIELSPELAQIAEANRQRVGAARVKYHCADAATIIDLDRFTHVYLFNPFPVAVVRQVMKNLKASHARHPRPITLIFKYPGCPLGVDRELFPYSELWPFAGTHPFHVYRTDWLSAAELT